MERDERKGDSDAWVTQHTNHLFFRLVYIYFYLFTQSLPLLIEVVWQQQEQSSAP